MILLDALIVDESYSKHKRRDGRRKHFDRVLQIGECPLDQLANGPTSGAHPRTS